MFVLWHLQYFWQDVVPSKGELYEEEEVRTSSATGSDDPWFKCSGFSYIIIVIISNASGIDSCIEGQEILYVFFKRWGDRAGKKLKKQQHHQPSTTQACSRHWKFLFQNFWRRSYVWSVELPPYLNRIGNRSVGFGWRLMILRLAYQNGRREEFCNYKAWQ